MTRKKKKLRLGFLINPVAGAGGPAALKGSDAVATREAVFSGHLASSSAARASLFFKALKESLQHMQVFCVAGPMGSDILDDAGVECTLLDCEVKRASDREDTVAVCEALIRLGIDLLVFAGGDGTARDVFDAVADKQLCLGIPSGVKMQSAVFGIHPQASAEVVRALTEGQPVLAQAREVRDIDEAALSQGVVKSRYYGELKTPMLESFVQQVKQGSGNVDELLIADIAEELHERLQDLPEDFLLVFGPGSTTREVQKNLGFESTLLGVDACSRRQCFLDLNENELSALLANKNKRAIRLVLTIVGGQGHIIGRGNQQLSPRVLEFVGRENLWILAAPHKLLSLNGRPLIIDSGSETLNKAWQGLVEVITGYQKVSLHYLE